MIAPVVVATASAVFILNKYSFISGLVVLAGAAEAGAEAGAAEAGAEDEAGADSGGTFLSSATQTCLAS